MLERHPNANSTLAAGTGSDAMLAEWSRQVTTNLEHETRRGIALSAGARERDDEAPTEPDLPVGAADAGTPGTGGGGDGAGGGGPGDPGGTGGSGGPGGPGDPGGTGGSGGPGGPGHPGGTGGGDDGGDEPPDDPDNAHGDGDGDRADREPGPAGEGPQTEPTIPMAGGPTETPTGQRRLLRSRRDRMIGGVAGGLGDYFQVDPIVFRIAFGVLAFFGGLGLLAYLAAWLFVPEDAGDGTPVQTRPKWVLIAGGVALALLAIAFIGDGPWWTLGAAEPIGWLFLVAVLVGIIAFTIQSVRSNTAGGDGSQRKLTAGRVAVLTVLWIGAIGLGVVVAMASAWAGAAGWGAAIAGLVIALGVIMVGSSFVGGAAWLAIPALILAIPASVVAASGVEFEGGYGDRVHRPVTYASIPGDGYKLAAGTMFVDLRDFRFHRARPLSLDIQQGAGSLTVVVPTGVCVVGKVHADAGMATMNGTSNGGLDTQVDEERATTGPAVPTVRINADMGLGVVRVGDEKQPGYVAAGEGWRDPHDDALDRDDPEAQRRAREACEGRAR